MASCVYQIYTLKLVLLAVCIPGIQQVVCVCMEEGWRNSRRYVRLDIIQRNLRRKWRLSAKSSADFLYEMWHYMYVHVSLISDRYILSLKKREACRYCHFAFTTFLFPSAGFFSRPFWEMKKV